MKDYTLMLIALATGLALAGLGTWITRKDHSKKPKR